VDDVLLVLMLVAFGFLTGALSGLLGVGGGIFMVPFLVLALEFSQQEAQATSLFVVLPTAIVATVSLRRRGVGDLPTGLRIGVIGSLGGVAGALLALVLPTVALRLAFAALLTVVGLRLLLDARHPTGADGPPAASPPAGRDASDPAPPPDG
jgi:uncharacterized membrane protein YfcA